MANYAYKGQDWQTLQKQITELLESEDPIKLEKAETLAAMYILARVGYDEGGASESLIWAAQNALHDVIGVYLNILMKAKV